jgi:hypothetical protein
VLLAAALPFLVPRRRSRVEAPAPRGVPRWALAAAVLVGVLVPLVLVIAARPQPATYATARSIAHETEAPLTDDLAATVGGRQLEWHAIDGHGSRIYYVVFRVDRRSGGCTPPTAGARECLFAGSMVGTTRSTAFQVPSGRSTYRVGASANYVDAQNGADLFLLGPPVTVP